MAFLHGVESNTLSQRGHMGRRKGVLLPRLEASSGQQCFPKPTAWGNKGKSHLFQVHGKTQAWEMVLLGIQRERCYPLGNNCIEEILSSPTRPVHSLLFNLGDGYS